jgi:excisionase family DNA binding protein
MSDDQAAGLRPLVTVGQAAKQLGVSKFIARQAIKQGLLDAITFGPRTVRVLPESVDRVRAGNKPDPA